MPEVSIIIPTLNRSDFLALALLSIAAQTFQDFEVIVVDDHSTENIKQALLPFQQQMRVHYLKNEGKGVSSARNAGIRFSKSAFIAFLDSDDQWAPEKLHLQLEFLKQHCELQMVYTNEQWIRNGTQITPPKTHKKLGGRIFNECTQQCLIGPSSVLACRPLFQSIGLFDETFPACEDFDLWLRIASQQNIGYLPEPLTIKHGGHSDQLSMQFHSMDLWRVRALAKHVHNPLLTEEEKKLVLDTIKKKAHILIKGFHKHQNFQNLQEMQQMLCVST